MYRISIIRDPSAKGVYSRGYFGPCYLEDKLSPEEIEKYKNPSNYVNIASLFNEQSVLPKLKKLLEDANVGNSEDWTRFRYDKKYILHMCKKGAGAVPSSIHFLRPEIAEYLGYPGVPILVSPWKGLDEASKNIVGANYKPVQRSSVTRSGDEVVKVAYTGNLEELLKYQSEVVTPPPFSVAVWGFILEGKKAQNKYSVSKKLLEAAKNKKLSPEEKQQKYNQILEESFYGLESNERLYKYTGDPKNPKANLEVQHIGKSGKRNISKEGFTLGEWKDLVFGGILPAPLRGKQLSPEKTNQILNGVVDSVQRVIRQPKFKYTGDNPHTLEKMRLTGLSPDQYYTQNQWCDSLVKVKELELVEPPYNLERQKKYKLAPTELPLTDDYKAKLSELNNLSNDNFADKIIATRAWFRKKLERAGINDAKNTLKEIQESSDDAFAIKEFIQDLQRNDNLLIDECYTKQIGSSGEKILQRELTKGLGPEFKYQRTLSINVIPPGSDQTILMIFDGAILKDGKIVMLFEVQGAQHYSFNQRHYKTYSDFQERLYRDKVKMDFCRQNNIPLFTVSHVLDSMEAASIYNKLVKSGALNNLIPKGSQADYNFSNLNEEDSFQWVDKYVDNLVYSHFSPIINTSSYENVIPKINRIMNDLSKLVMIAISNQYNSKMQDTSFVENFSKQTLLDEGHRKLVDSFNKYFGDKYKMDYQDNVTYLGQVLKMKEPMPAPVQEMALVRHKKKKRYKIRRIR